MKKLSFEESKFKKVSQKDCKIHEVSNYLYNMIIIQPENVSF